jgi:carbamoyl-phosphate synthase large subunit
MPKMYRRLLSPIKQLMSNKIPILMTGGGAPGGAGIIRCLQAESRFVLHVGDANETATGRFLNDRFVRLPKASDSYFVDFVLDYCLKNGIKVIFPLVTMELFKFSASIDVFDKNNIKVIVSQKTSLDIANNKSRLYEHLTKHSILTPQYSVVPAGDFDAFLAAFSELGFPEKPIAVKPSVSNGSRGVRLVDNSVDKFDLLFHHKPSSLYCTFNELANILRGRSFPELLVSEVLMGEEFTIDTIVNAEGKAEIILPRLRKKMLGGISVEGQFIQNQEIIEYCHQIIGSLKLFGPIGIQVKLAADGRFKILEINPRIQGTSVAAMGLGINLPVWAVKQALGEKVEIPTIEWGKRFARYWNEVYF